MNGSYQVSPGVRNTLTAPRGHRFSHTRPGRRPMPATREELFEQMMEHPKVRLRVERGEVPQWMLDAAGQSVSHDRAAPAPARAVEEPLRVPRPRPAPDEHPRPKPPLPRRPRSHRKPRSRSGWRLAAYALAAATGALAHHLATVLL